VKKKPRASAKRTKRVTPKTRVHNVSDAMRADDDKLRDALANADLRKLDDALEFAIRPRRA
jgi:hypothetical protein